MQPVGRSVSLRRALLVPVLAAWLWTVSRPSPIALPLRAWSEPGPRMLEQLVGPMVKFAVGPGLWHVKCIGTSTTSVQSSCRLTPLAQGTTIARQASS